MTTPICCFAAKYAAGDPVRLHMPGHKGVCDPRDITEITGADVLYHADGVIRESEENAASLFGTARTVYSTGGSSLCIRAMVYLISLTAPRGRRVKILAARNAHRTFVTACALLDADVTWLRPEVGGLVSCPVSAGKLEAEILSCHPDAVYITSPDYTGNVADIAALSEVCRRHSVILAVDNAHGAYLKFLPVSRHPIDLGADICCDSAHKTLPVLTGGAYLHISRSAPSVFRECADSAMALFASTSPSYLILGSLDRANAVMADGFPELIAGCAGRVAGLKGRLCAHGFTVVSDEPLKLTVMTKGFGYTGHEVSLYLESRGVYCEFADPDAVVMMFSPMNRESDFAAVGDALCTLKRREAILSRPPVPEAAEAVMTPHEAIMAVSEKTPVRLSVGKILAEVSVTCPPAVPVLICGERIGEQSVKCFEYYGIEAVRTVKG